VIVGFNVSGILNEQWSELKCTRHKYDLQICIGLLELVALSVYTGSLSMIRDQSYGYVCIKNVNIECK
jgi:hypothetical protein